MIKEKFLNYSIQKKFNVTLLLFVILPVVLFGLGVVVERYRGDIRELYNVYFHDLEMSMNDIENSYVQINNIRLECLVKDAVRRIGENRAADKDYVEVRQWIDNIYEQNSICENISVILDNGKQFQTGRYIRENVDKIAQRLEKKAISWKLGEEIEYVLNLRNPYEGAVIGYTASIVDPIVMQKSIGVLSIKIKETEIENLYSRQMPAGSENAFLVTKESRIVVSSTDKSRINQVYEKWDQIKFVDGQNEAVCFSGGTLLLCRYSEKIDCYLIYEVLFNRFLKNIFPIIRVVFASIVMCVLFCVIFGMLQKKYVIKPLYAVVQTFGKVENGELQLIQFEKRGDEIGMLQKSLNQMIEKLDTMIKQVYKTQIEKTEAELRALSEQINPHFLYNTLDSIHWKAICNKDSEVAEQVMALADIYRYLLNSGRDFIRIKDEVYFLEKYLFLMSVRFGERICWEVDIDSSVLEMEIPKLLIQPLLENAIHHGLEPVSEGGRIQMKIQLSKSILEIVVEDTGIGFGKDMFLKNEDIPKLENSFAIKNIYNRLELYYPDRFEYTIQSSKDGGSRVILAIYVNGDSLDEINDSG